MSVFSHVVIGSNDIAKAKAFYDAALGALGLNCLMSTDSRLMYGVEGPQFIVTTPRNGEPASAANGGTIGFNAPNPAAIDAFHAQALANGGSCEGPPGPREIIPNSYAAYVRDPDGNKLCSFIFSVEE